MNLKFVKSSQKRKIIEQLKDQFGITKIPHLLIETGKQKYRGYSGHLSKDEIKQLAKLTNIEMIGLYLLKFEGDWRLSMDATQLLKDQIKKNIVEINPQQYDKWMHGRDLDIKTKTKDTVVIKYKDDFIGCGKSNMKKIFNYVPKERRLKN